jgi:hypothetical protein
MDTEKMKPIAKGRSRETGMYLRVDIHRREAFSLLAYCVAPGNLKRALRAVRSFRRRSVARAPAAESTHGSLDAVVQKVVHEQKHCSR